MNAIPWEALDGLGTVGVVVLVGAALLTGRVYTRAAALELKEDRDFWRDQALKLMAADKTRSVAQEHLSASVEKLTRVVERRIAPVSKGDDSELLEERGP